MATQDGRTVDAIQVTTTNIRIPSDYWLGSVGDQLAYWRRRATSAEARCLGLEEHIASLRASRAWP